MRAFCQQRLSDPEERVDPDGGRPHVCVCQRASDGMRCGAEHLRLHSNNNNRNGINPCTSGGGIFMHLVSLLPRISRSLFPSPARIPSRRWCSRSEAAEQMARKIRTTMKRRDKRARPEPQTKAKVRSGKKDVRINCLR